MGFAGRIIILLILALSVLFLTTVIYLRVYKKRINQRLREGDFGEGEETSKRKMLTPIAVFVLTLLGVTAGAYMLILLFAWLFSAKSDTRYETSHIHTVTLDSESRKDTLFEDCLPGEEIKGYTVHTMQDGDIRFTYYVNKYPYSGILPTLLISAEYTGGKDMVGSGYRMGLSAPGEKEGTSFGGTGLDPDPQTMTAVTVDDFAGVLTYTYGVFDSGDYGTDNTEQDGRVSDPLEGAAAKGTFTFDFDTLPSYLQ
ncbi:MAG: hypothetical protein IJ806_08875 [Ruminococcus sp.]|nr:hypothetical protein [Ruminococcus sp.]